jgi:hypothetical protein
MARTTNKLQPYRPKVKPSDLLLHREPTLDAIGNDIKGLVAFYLKCADGGNIAAYLIGLRLNQAQGMIPKARRGVHGGATNGEGFTEWKRATFPGLSLQALWQFGKFAEEVTRRIADTAGDPKNPEPGFLELARPETFETKISPAQLVRLTALLGDVLSSKTISAFLRSLNRMRQPQIGAGGHRPGPRDKRTKKEIEEAERKEGAATAGKVLREILDGWEENRHWLFLEDRPLQELREAVDGLHHALSTLAKDRKLPRLPENWRQNTHHA